MKKTFLVLIILFITTKFLLAWETIAMSTITAEAVLTVPDLEKPKIVHQPLKNILPYYKTILIYAEIFDDVRINAVNVYYKIDEEINFSTLTLTLSGNTTYYCLKETINVTPNKTFYYRIEADDGYNSEFYPSSFTWVNTGISGEATKTISPAGGEVTLYDGNPLDGETKIKIPEGALENAVEIKIIELNPGDNSIPDGSDLCLTKRPYTVYEFLPSGITFKKPVEISLVYPATNDEKIDIFWLDKIQKWRVVGGKSDPQQNTISAKISHFSIFAIFPRKVLTASDYRPKERIITPFGDNKKIHFDGIAGIETEIKIFDIRGRKVKTISASPYEWDATDDSGNIVESGVYIYQFRTESTAKPVSGTIVVAK